MHGYRLCLQLQLQHSARAHFTAHAVHAARHAHAALTCAPLSFLSRAVFVGWLTVLCWRAPLSKVRPERLTAARRPRLSGVFTWRHSAALRPRATRATRATRALAPVRLSSHTSAATPQPLCLGSHRIGGPRFVRYPPLPTSTATPRQGQRQLPALPLATCYLLLTTYPSQARASTTPTTARRWRAPSRARTTCAPWLSSTACR